MPALRTSVYSGPDLAGARSALTLRPFETKVPIEFQGATRGPIRPTMSALAAA